MSKGAEAIYNHCVEGEVEESETNDKSFITGIVNLAEMPNKSIGYTVYHKPIVTKSSKKFFTGIVMVPRGMTGGDLFTRLETFFGSQNDITSILKDTSIDGIRTKISGKYNDKSYKLGLVLDECKVRLLDTTEVKWWSLEELEKLGEETPVTSPTPGFESEKVKNKDQPKAATSKSSEIGVEEDHNKKVLTSEVTDGKILSKESNETKGEENDKDRKIAGLQKEMKDLNTAIQKGAKEAKSVMEEKDNQIRLLEIEMDDSEKKIKELQKSIGELTQEKMDWHQDLEDEENANKQVKETEEITIKLEMMVQEKDSVEAKLQKAEDELVIKENKLKEAHEQLKEIRENSSFLQSELVKQKAEMGEETNQLKNKLDKQTKELDTIKKELGEKDNEIKSLRQKLEDATKATKEDGQLKKILAYIDSKETPKAREYTSSRKPMFSKGAADLQVARVRSKESNIMMVGHPEIFRNFENIATVRNNINDLIESKNLTLITADFQGFVFKNLIEDVNEKIKKPLYSEVTQNENEEKEFSCVTIFPGNLHVAEDFMKEHGSKDEYILNKKYRTEVEGLVDVIVEIVNAVAGKCKEVVIALDPATVRTFEFSRKLAVTLAKSTQDWRDSRPGGDVPEIKVWDQIVDQENSGASKADKRNCIEVQEKGDSLWLDRSFLTEDKTRVSKRATISTFNKLVDLVVVDPAPGPACSKCGIQQSSSYVEKCNDNDTGDYRSCEACGKDGHTIDTCYAMKFQSDRVCKMGKCSRNGFKHSPKVHDIVNPHHQQVAKSTLKQEIEFFTRPRLKRPFFTPTTDGPPRKQAKY